MFKNLCVSQGNENKNEKSVWGGKFKYQVPVSRMNERGSKSNKFWRKLESYFNWNLQVTVTNNKKYSKQGPRKLKKKCRNTQKWNV